jgi:hypothetical protein
LSVSVDGQKIDREELANQQGRLPIQSAKQAMIQTVHGADAMKSCDAVAFLGVLPPTVDDITRLVDIRKHVLLATETILPFDDLQFLVACGTKAGVRVIVMNPDRMRPSRRLFYDELRGSKFGSVGLIRLHRWQSASPRALDSTQLPAPLVRDLDLVIWLAQQHPNVVHAIERKEGKTGTIQVHLGFESGGMALIDFADCLPQGDGYQSMSAICSTGAIYADDHSNCQLNFRGGSAHALPADEGLLPLVNSIQPFVETLSAKADVSRENMPWQDVFAVASAVRQSIDSGLAVSLEGH